VNFCRPDCDNTLGHDEQPFYSNLPLVALYWITVLSCGESNPEAGTLRKFVGNCLPQFDFERVTVQHAKLGTMAGLAVPVLDVMDGGGGVRSYSPYADRSRRLFHLRGGPQRQSDDQFQSRCPDSSHGWVAARRRCRGEGPAEFF
jgi:hypothetical protein